ncbi:hypothetical protein SEPCBS57363_000317 [Sporothrix epigloea]|uniref:Ankyrin repeat protein n=1 Tax=Sporothrix epigloea TaxID=1892477 RepID=A0ABP0D5K0_9PEZI
MAPNIYIMASDNDPALLPLLRANPELASRQDSHGYSLIHAAASYNHLDLLRALVNEFHVPVDLCDEDDETALYVVETIEAAKCLLDELGMPLMHTGKDGQTAAEKILDDEFQDVGEYLMDLQIAQMGPVEDESDEDSAPSSPEGMRMMMGTMPAAATVENSQHQGGSNSNNSNGAAAAAGPDDDALGGPPDPELRRRIEALAARPDFHTEQGQLELRQLVEDAVLGQGLGEERNVRPRQS